MADLEKRLPPLPADAPPGAVSTAVVTEPALATGPAWIGSVDDAAKAFELSPGQQADMERILADAKRDVDALRKVADETGATWETVEKDVVRMENGALHFDGTKLAAFREKVIPGRNESFGSTMRKPARTPPAARRTPCRRCSASRGRRRRRVASCPAPTAAAASASCPSSTVDVEVPAPAEPAMDGK